MKRIYKINFFTVLLISFLVSCEFGDTNVDPANPTSVPIRTLLPTVEARWAYIYGGDIARYNALFTQHFAGTSRQHLVLGQYNLTGSDVDNTWQDIYNSLMDARQIIEQAEELESPHYSGVAKVITANILGVATDLFGNIPYSEALEGNDNFKPTYDTREDIYATVHTLLAEARAELEAESVLSPGTEDLIYGGDLNSWIKASYALDARYYLHKGRYTDAITAVGNSFTSPSENFTFGAFSNSPTESNPLFQFIEQRTDIRLGKFFVDRLVAQNDPRTSQLVERYEGGFVGVPAGVDDEGSLPGTYYASRNSPVPFITYTELKFIEAESHLQKSSSDRAAAAMAMREAISASVSEITGSENAEFAASVTPSAANITLQDIILQKYIAFAYQPETYNDYRRTGLPNLSPAKGANVEFSGGMIPQRWPYPQEELQFNKANFEANQPASPVLAQKLSW